MTTLMAIGGNEDHSKPFLLKEFLRRAGGENALVVVLPQSSILQATGQEYAQLFLRLGARHAHSLEFRTRAEASAEEFRQAIKSASGVFLTGGTQMRLAAMIGGTALETALLEVYRRGVIVAGTSAGAAVMSRVMIANGRGGPAPREGIAQFSAGVGFTDKIVFDQHFRQKDRLGRLLYAVAANPGLLGVGIDENTAAILEDDVRILVEGSGGVTILDGSQIEATDVADVSNGRPVAVSNVRIHVLTQGCSFDAIQRRAHLPGAVLTS